MFENLTLIGLLTFMIVREVMHFLQVSKLQELLKSVDVTEYYRAKSLGQKPREATPSPSENSIMEKNELLDAADFDITKVSKINVDGDERDIKIY